MKHHAPQETQAEITLCIIIPVILTIVHIFYSGNLADLEELKCSDNIV